MPRLNRIVELQEPVVSRDAYGGEIVTWTTRAKVWASFENVGKNTERYIRAASKVKVFRMGRFEIRPPTVNFDERWRILEGSRVWDVAGIDKEGSLGSKLGHRGQGMTTCAHVYELEAPNGRESLGRCLRCGAVKTHFNSAPDGASGWGRGQGTLRRKAAGA